MLDKLEAIEQRYEELNRLMAQPEVATDVEKLQSLAREQATLEEVVTRYREYKKTLSELEETQSLLEDGADPQMAALVKEELQRLKARKEELLKEIKLALLPRDPNDDKDVIMEIRAGTGGEEAALFAADLFRMYTRYAQSKGWEVEVIDSNESGIGGFKEVIFEVKGKGAFSRLKYERGVHRVQRVPVTEASGRIHTSTATVAVLPEAEEVEVDIHPDDLRIDFYHSRGAGGQNVNKVATAVRITHLPTGIVATCQDERSQLRNRMKAMAVLRARLLDREQRRQQEEITRERRSQVGSGERAEKIRTYNFPQDRVTDHRINLTLHNLPALLEGELDELIDALATTEQAKQLEESRLDPGTGAFSG
jgi:peptide chain release factor 1